MLKRANRKTDTFFPLQFLMELHTREEGTAQQQPQALEYTESFLFGSQKLLALSVHENLNGFATVGVPRPLQDYFQFRSFEGGLVDLN